MKNIKLLSVIAIVLITSMVLAGCTGNNSKNEKAFLDALLSNNADAFAAVAENVSDEFYKKMIETYFMVNTTHMELLLINAHNNSKTEILEFYSELYNAYIAAHLEEENARMEAQRANDPVLSESDFQVTVTRDSRGVVITGYTGQTAYVNIPATIQGMPVREIGQNAFLRNNIIKEVVIPEGVTTIGDGAFAISRNLTIVSIPQSVTHIGDRAFANTGLTSVTLSPRILYGSSTFHSGVFAECDKLVEVIIPEGVTTQITGAIFEKCTALTSITLPSTITRIGGGAFYGCTALTNVTIPDSITRIQFADGQYETFHRSNLNLVSQTALRRVGYRDNF